MTWLPWVWIAMAVVMGAIELGTGTFMFLLFALAAALAGVAGFCGISLLGQAVVFLCGVIGAVAAAPALVKRIDKASRTGAKFGVDALIDEIGLVTMAIDPLHGTGMIKVGGELWRAQASVAVEVGRRVRVDAVSGTKLLVHPLPVDEEQAIAPRMGADSGELTGEVEA